MSACTRLTARLTAVVAGLACAATLLAGCGEEQKEALAVPDKKHTEPVAPERKLGREVKVLPATLKNALEGHTRGALTLRVTSARLGLRYAWLAVEDDTASAWAVVPPLAVTPTGTVTLDSWVRQRADGPVGQRVADVAGNDGLILWAAQVSGATIKHRELGEEAVIDPVFATLEVTGTVAESAPPSIAPADHSIAALHADKAHLEGKQVKIRGQVLHVVPDLGGRTWWILRDGKPAEGEPADPFASGDTHILPVAANQPIDPGEVVLVSGTVRVDHAFTLTGPLPVVLMPASVLKDTATPAADPADTPAEATPAATPAADAPPAGAPPADAPPAGKAEADTPPAEEGP